MLSKRVRTETDLLVIVVDLHVFSFLIYIYVCVKINFPTLARNPDSHRSLSMNLPANSVVKSDVKKNVGYLKNVKHALKILACDGSRFLTNNFPLTHTLLFGCLGNPGPSLRTAGFVCALLRPPVSSTRLRGLRRLGLATPQCLENPLKAVEERF